MRHIIFRVIFTFRIDVNTDQLVVRLWKDDRQKMTTIPII